MGSVVCFHPKEVMSMVDEIVERIKRLNEEQIDMLISLLMRPESVTDDQVPQYPFGSLSQ